MSTATPEMVAEKVISDTADHGVGRWSMRSLMILVLGLIGLGIGVVAYYIQFTEGEGVTNLGTVGGDGATWGLYITMAVYFIGLSFAGITISSLVRLFRIEALKPIRRVAELLTVICLMLGGLLIVADLGQPLRGLINLPRYARPMSPFFGTFTLVIAGYLFASLVFLYLSGRRDAAVMAEKGTGPTWLYKMWSMGFTDTQAEHARHERTSFWLALMILPLLVLAHSTLGFIFGIQSGRPGWFNGLQAPSFVVLAGLSGIGALIVVLGWMSWGGGATKAKLPQATWKWLGNFLWITALVYLYLWVTELLTGLYAAPVAEQAVFDALVTGDYAIWYWSAFAAVAITFVVGFIMFVSNRWNVAVLIVLGLLVNAAAIIKRYLIVVPSQTIGNLLPYEVGHYVPNGIEFMVLIGVAGLGLLMYLVFMKFFPVFAVAGKSKDHWATSQELTKAIPKDSGRTMMFWITLVLGLALIVVGLALVAPLGETSSDVISEPKMEFAPMLFIIGVIVVFLAPVVYELKGGGKTPPETSE